MTFYLVVIVLSLVIGGIIRLLLKNSKNGYLFTVISAFFTVVSIAIVCDPPRTGSELYGLRAIQLFCLTLGASVAAIIISRRKS